MAGLYIHIPFCASRCIYCGFYSTTLSGLKQRYVDALCREMELAKCNLRDDKIATIYVGGGTPSQLSIPLIGQIFDAVYSNYDVEDHAEVTIECNPDDVTEEFATQLYRLAVNRVSMGAQTFSDERLRFLHRRHTASQVQQAVKNLRRAGIGNISIDLMYGFPNQTVVEWHDDISSALELGVEHISAYCLMIEEGTELYKMNLQASSKECDEETQRMMYYDLVDRLTAAGYEHYEISNFARKGLRSRHNSGYWKDIPYIGIGASAHSYYGSTRRWNVSDVKQYISSCELRNDSYEAGMEPIDAETHYNDRIMLALRTCEGLNLGELNTRQRDYLLSVAQKHVEAGLLEYDWQSLRLSHEGLFVSDMVISELMIV